MIHLQWPVMLGAILAGLGIYGVIARRNAVLVLIGVELILNAANLLLVTAGTRPGSPFAAGSVVTLFVITIAAAEISIALAVILVMFRRFGHIDLTAVPDLSQPEPTEAGPAPPGPAPPGPTQPGPAPPGPNQPGPNQPGPTQPGPAPPGPNQLGSNQRVPNEARS